MIESPIIQASDSSFMVRGIQPGEVTRWEEQVGNVAPHLRRYVVAGLSAISASMQELAGDRQGRFTSALEVPLFADPGLSRVNGELLEDRFPELRLSSSRTDNERVLFELGVSLINVAHAANALEAASKGKFAWDGSGIGRTDRDSTFTVNIPESQQGESGILLRTHPSEEPVTSVSMRYTQTDRGKGYTVLNGYDLVHV
jgi:hypothetical protein